MRKLLLILLALGFFFSCKKKTKEVQPAVVPENAITPLADSIPTKTEGSEWFIKKMLTVDTIQKYDFSLAFLGTQHFYYDKKKYGNKPAYTVYWADAGILNGLGQPAQKGEIWVNYLLATFSESSRFYTKDADAYLNLESRFHWKLDGDVGFPAQAFEMPIPFPDKATVVSLPDTLDVSESFTVQLDKEIANADTVLFSVYAFNRANLLGQRDHFTKAKGCTAYTYPAKDLAYIKSLGGGAYLEVSTLRYHLGMVGSRKALFQTKKTVQILIVLK